jgi:hypothetical protein
MIGYFPTPYPGEIFYSTIARYCEIMRFPNHKSVLYELFRTESILAIFDLPKALAHFVAQLPPGHHYDVDSLIDNHTLLPLYAPFLPPERLAMVRQSMKENLSGPVHMLRGVLGNHVRPVPYLRYCPCCSADDQAHFGETYWRRLHQAPGVEVCPDHQILLEKANLVEPMRGTARAFITAQSSCLPTRPREIDEKSHDNRLLLGIAQDVEWILDQPRLVVGPKLLHQCYLNLAILRGWITCDGMIFRERILKEFTAKYSSQLLAALKCEITLKEGTAWFLRLLWSPYSSQPPVRQFLLMETLGYGAAAFFQSLDRLRNVPFSPFGSGPWPCRNPVCSSHGQHTITAVQLAHSAFRKKTTGSFKCPRCGFSYCKVANGGSGSPAWVKDYGPVWRAILNERWSDRRWGVSSIADVLGVDPITVRRQAGKLRGALPRK